MISVGRTSVKDSALQRWIDSVVQSLRELQNPIARGVLIEDIVLAPGQNNVINHGLQRGARGWFIVESDAGFEDTPYRVKSAEKLPTQLVLYAPAASSATVTISLWVF